jgi:hypothetical protein
MSFSLQIFKGICVGRASRLTESDLRPRASGLEPTTRKARALIRSFFDEPGGGKTELLALHDKNSIPVDRGW